MGKLRKRKHEREDRERHKQYVDLPMELARAGKYLSDSALRVYIVIASRNPSYASLTTIQIETGHGREYVVNGIEECILKNLITKKSGAAKRENNLYRIRPKAEWDLLTRIMTPSEKRSARARQRVEVGQGAGEPSDKYDYRTRTRSIIDQPAGSIIERELDQVKLDQSIIVRRPASQTELGAGGTFGPGRRSPDGQDLNPEEKGVGRKADEIERRATERWKMVEAAKKTPPPPNC